MPNLYSRGVQASLPSLFNAYSYEVAVIDSANQPFNLTDLISEEPTLRATATFTFVSPNVIELEATHDTTSLTGTFNATYAVLVITDGVDDLNLLAWGDMVQAIAPSSDLETKFTITLTPEL